MHEVPPFLKSGHIMLFFLTVLNLHTAKSDLATSDSKKEYERGKKKYQQLLKKQETLLRGQHIILIVPLHKIDLWRYNILFSFCERGRKQVSQFIIKGTL